MHENFVEIPLPEEYSLNDILEGMRRNSELIESEKSIVSVNGIEGMSGWRLLTDFRHRLQGDFSDLGTQMVVVRTDELLMRFAGAKSFATMDFVQQRGNKLYYWFELAEKKVYSPVIARKSVTGFEASMFQIGGREEFKVFFPCKEEEYEGIVNSLIEAEAIRIWGMKVDASTSYSKQKQYFIVQGYKIVERDYSGAENVLVALNNWEDLIPMRHYYNQEPLFDEITSLAMMVSVLFTRKEQGVFNTIFFGPSQHGKTAVLKFFVCDVMGGSFESATASSGKAWLISHKEGAPPSKLFTEKRAMLVDEMLKSVSTGMGGNWHTFAMSIKSLMQKHMQILDKEKVDASSGVGPVKGVMRCSFVGTENDDDVLQEALGRAEFMSPAAFKRIQIGYAERSSDIFDEVSVNAKLAKDKQKEYFYKRFGKNALKDICSLYMYSRKFTENPKNVAPRWWIISMRWWLLHVANDFINEQYPDVQKKLADIVRLQHDCVEACWISAAVIRGWEVHDSLDKLDLVFDFKQQKMAEDLASYFLISRLKVLWKGIEKQFPEKGVVRTTW